MKRPVVLVLVLVAAASTLWFVLPIAIDQRSTATAGGGGGPSAIRARNLAEAVTAHLDARKEIPSEANADAARDDALRSLLAALASRDQAAMGDAASRWFAAGPGAVEAIFERLEGLDGDSPSVVAIGILLACSVELALLGSPAVEPWTVTDIAEYGLDMIRFGSGAAQVMGMGLRQAGPHLPGRLAPAVLRQYSGPDATELGISGQLALLQLAEQWAKDMPPDVENELFLTAFDLTAGPNVTAQAAAGLLHRDWVTFTPLLMEERAQRGAKAEMEAYLTEDVTPGMPSVMASYASRLPEVERVGFARSVIKDPAVAHSVLEWLDESSMRTLHDQIRTDEEVPESVRNMVAFLSEADGAMQLGLDILEGPPAVPWHYHGSVLTELLRRGASDDPRFQAIMERRFEQRGNEPRFWLELDYAACQLDREEARAMVLPWIERTAGEKHYSREAVLESLRVRYPDWGL